MGQGNKGGCYKGHQRAGLGGSAGGPGFHGTVAVKLTQRESRNGDAMRAVRPVLALLPVHLPGFRGGTWGVCDRMPRDFL